MSIDKLSNRLEEAQSRLQAALVAGESTVVHRQAVSQIEGDIKGERERQRRNESSLDEQRDSDVAKRAHEIAAASRKRIEESISQFPIPELPL